MAAPLTPDDPRRLGEFQLTGRLGEGGQGVVYLGRTPEGEPVAVKVLRIGSNPHVRARLARELGALRTVASFCTARVLTASVEGPQPYVVSEFIDGPSLQERVTSGNPLRGGELERLAVGTATALAAIHGSGIIHRDFKPANVLLGPDGPRVVDFGIARQDEVQTITTGLIGTPAYLAPEQVAGHPATSASDVFAWASTVVFAATGRTAFGSDTVAAVLLRIATATPDLSQVPEPLRSTVARCLDKDPARRPTARDLLLLLVGSADPAPGPSLSTGPGGGNHRQTYPGRGGRRSQRGLIAGAVAVLTALAATGWLLWPRSAENSGGGTDPSVSITTDGPAAVGTPIKSTTARTPAPSASGTGSATNVPASPAPSASRSRATGTVIPTAFAGTWTGHITPSNPLISEYDVTIDLPGGTGMGAWSTDSCQGELRLTKVTAARLTFMLEKVAGCVPGTLTLTMNGKTLDYFWRDMPGQNILTESGPLTKAS